MTFLEKEENNGSIDSLLELHNHGSVFPSVFMAQLPEIWFCQSSKLTLRFGDRKGFYFEMLKA